jgi:hypothetical protein
MKQRLGEKKHRLCEQIADRPYRRCYTSGHYGHGIAECWFGDGDPLRDADEVNYVTRTVRPKIRDGQAAPTPMDELRAMVSR